MVIVVSDLNPKEGFLIPKSVAVNQKILSSTTSPRKMALGVYSPWYSNLNKTVKVANKLVYSSIRREIASSIQEFILGLSCESNGNRGKIVQITKDCFIKQKN